VYREADVEPVVERLLLDEAARAALLERAARIAFAPDATGRVVSLVAELIATCN
jgi:hypothetical protein